MKSLYYSSSLSDHPIPEHDVLRESPIDYNEDISSSASRSGSSCSSSLGEEENGHYPPDLLGLSWGSYLHSGPPTAGRSSRRVVINTEPQTAPKVLSPTFPATAEQDVSASPSRSQPRGILRTPVAKESSAGKLRGTGLDERRGETAINEPHPLLQALLSLASALAKARDELKGTGIDYSPFASMCDAFEASSRKLTEALASEDGRELAAAGMLQAVAACLEAVVMGVISQGGVLRDQAAFLQQTGTHLAKSQRQFLEEQEDIRKGMEAEKAKLSREKQHLEEEKLAVASVQEELQGFPGRLSAQEAYCGGSHLATTSAGGHTQMVALVHTQKQQSKLEKLLLQQQRELQKLCKAHEATKAELIGAQEHSRRLHQRLTNVTNEAKRTTAALSSQLQSAQHSLSRTHHELDREKRRAQQESSSVISAKRRDTMAVKTKGFVAGQKSLSHEIERMRQQLSAQQQQEHDLKEQLETSRQQLGRTGKQILRQTKWLTSHHPQGSSAVMDHPNHQRPKPLGKSEKLPRIHGAPSKKTLTGDSSTSSLVLPKLAHAPSSTRKKLPSYHFTKTELISLATFEDPATAEEVALWLGQQGLLQDT